VTAIVEAGAKVKRKKEKKKIKKIKKKKNLLVVANLLRNKKF
jgi:hypothetical protein